jgi:exodeoxyribonuclease VII small subunit
MAAKTFEEAMNRLEQIVEQLEQEELSLEKSLEIFEEGMELSKFCYEKLNQAEQKLKKLIKKDDGFQLELM